MSITYPQTWEGNLLSRAAEAHAGKSPALYRPVAAPDILSRAFAYCDAITAEHSRSFYFASRLLSAEKRRAIRTLYAFCRVCDNIVDCPEGDEEAGLDRWRRRALSWRPRADDLVATAWMDTRLRYRIPRRYAEQLIEGVGRDLRQKRYGTFEELTEYAYGVASTVGLMSMHIIGFAGPQAVPYAIKLGVALQLTNILRDVGEDWRAGRLYLPGRELDAFGLTEGDIGAGRVDERWREFMRFQIGRNRRLYAEAWPGIAMLNKDGRLAVAVAAELYCAILQDIEVHDYDVFQRRAQVDKWGKVSRLPGIWWRSR